VTRESRRIGEGRKGVYSKVSSVHLPGELSVVSLSKHSERRNEDGQDEENTPFVGRDAAIDARELVRSLIFEAHAQLFKGDWGRPQRLKAPGERKKTHLVMLRPRHQPLLQVPHTLLDDLLERVDKSLCLFPRQPTGRGGSEASDGRMGVKVVCEGRSKDRVSKQAIRKRVRLISGTHGVLRRVGRCGLMRRTRETGRGEGRLGEMGGGPELFLGVIGVQCGRAFCSRVSGGSKNAVRSGNN
jgi:hypothetical protein